MKPEMGFDQRRALQAAVRYTWVTAERPPIDEFMSCVVQAAQAINIPGASEYSEGCNLSPDLDYSLIRQTEQGFESLGYSYRSGGEVATPFSNSSFVPLPPTLKSLFEQLFFHPLEVRDLAVLAESCGHSNNAKRNAQSYIERLRKVLDGPIRQQNKGSSIGVVRNVGYMFLGIRGLRIDLTR